MKELRGKNALLTGASRGLGVHIARALAREGVNIALSARSVSELEKVKNKIISNGGKACIIPADLNQPERLKNLAEEAEEKLGTIDILINNAGVEFASLFEKFPSEEMEKSVRVNLLAPMLLTRAVLPQMLKRRRGHIVNISSLAGKTGLPYQTPYGAAKAGLVMFTHSLRAELMEQPVNVSVICPGFVSEDGMFARVEKAGNPPKLLKPSTPEKVAKAVIKAVKQNIAEIIINPFPMRPGIIMKEIFPQISPLLHKLTGTTKFARGIAENNSVPE